MYIHVIEKRTPKFFFNSINHNSIPREQEKDDDVNCVLRDLCANGCFVLREFEVQQKLASSSNGGYC